MMTLEKICTDYAAFGEYCDPNGLVSRDEFTTRGPLHWAKGIAGAKVDIAHDDEVYLAALRVQAAYDRATGAWTTCDWPVTDDTCHEIVPSDDYVRSVECSAISAEHNAAAAMTAFANGDVIEATGRIGLATLAERAYGDAPTWGPVNRAMLAWEAAFLAKDIE